MDMNNLSLFSTLCYYNGFLIVKNNFIFFFSFTCEVAGIVDSWSMTATATALPTEIKNKPNQNKTRVKEHGYRE